LEVGGVYGQVGMRTCRNVRQWHPPPRNYEKCAQSKLVIENEMKYEISCTCVKIPIPVQVHYLVGMKFNKIEQNYVEQV
jgi:hypothetical protein